MYRVVANSFWRFLMGPICLAMGLVSAAAFDQHDHGSLLEATRLSVELAQINYVNELSDVAPEDWGYTALQTISGAVARS